jgi:hypothetical protein
MSLSRRSFGLGVLGALATPAIIRTPGLLMPVKPNIVRLGYDITYEDFDAAVRAVGESVILPPQLRWPGLESWWSNQSDDGLRKWSAA